MSLGVSGLNHRSENSIKVKKSKCAAYCLALLLFLPNNIGTFPVLGGIFILLNNVAALFALLQLAYCALRKRRFAQSLSPVGMLAGLFFGIRIVLIYLHGGIFTPANWVTVIKWVVGVLWIDQAMQDQPERYDSILYGVWTWALLDILVTIISSGGSELFGGGYPLGWKNNKLEFLFLANLLALIKIQRDGLTGKDRFFRVWVVFATMSVLNPLLVDSGTTLLIITLLCIFPLLEKLAGNAKFFSGPLILAVHAALWFLVVVNNQAKNSVIGVVNEALFHRDATFTGRVYLWKTAMLLISQSFWTGYMENIEGYGQWTVITSELKGYQWEMAHNEVLELFMQGGLILFSCFAAILLLCLWRNRAASGRTFLGRWAIFVLLFSYLTEAFSGETTFIILIMIYRAGQLIREQSGVCAGNTLAAVYRQGDLYYARNTTEADSGSGTQL